MEHRKLFELMQHIDDDLIHEAIYAKKSHGSFEKFATAAAMILLCLFLSVGAVAAISPTFRDWLYEQFHQTKPEIIKLSFPEGINGIENGFLIRHMDTVEAEVYRVKEKEVVSCKTNILEGKVTYQGKKYDYSIKYAKEGKLLYAWDEQGAAMSMTGYDENRAIIWFETGQLWNSYFVELSTGHLTPIVNPDDYKEILSKQYYWQDGEDTIKGYVKLAVDVQVSSDGSYLLYRSNRECLTAKNGDYNVDARGFWYVQDALTGEEIKLEMLSGDLHSSEIGFLDDTHISSYEGANYAPVIYDCQWDRLEHLAKNMPGTNYWNSQIYEVTKNETQYQFWDLYLNETYNIPRSKGSQIQSSFASRNLIYVAETNGNQKAYLVKEKEALDFGKAAFSDLEEVTGMHDLGENQYIIEGYTNGNLVGYLLEFPQIEKEEKPKVRYYIQCPGNNWFWLNQYDQADGNKYEISVSDEEYQEAIDLMMEADIEVISSDDKNEEFLDRAGIAICFEEKTDKDKISYQLRAVKEDCVVLDVQKISLDREEDIVFKQFLIRSERLVSRIIEKTGYLPFDKTEINNCEKIDLTYHVDEEDHPSMNYSKRTLSQKEMDVFHGVMSRAEQVASHNESGPSNIQIEYYTKNHKYEMTISYPANSDGYIGVNGQYFKIAKDDYKVLDEICKNR